MPDHESAKDRTIRQMGNELRQVLLAEQLTQAALAERLSEISGDTQYDGALVSRWLKGRPISRAAARLLDENFRPSGSRTFERLRDIYILLHDRGDEELDLETGLAVEALHGGRCSVALASSRLPRRPMSLPDSSTLHWTFLSVVDTADSRLTLTGFFDRDHRADLLCLYDLRGQWDLAVKYLVRPGEDLQMVEADMLAALEANGQRPPNKTEFRDGLTLSVVSMRATDESEPSFLVLDGPEQYDKRRVQRGWILIDLRDDSTPRELVVHNLRRELAGLEEGVSKIIEAVTECDRGLLLELSSTCADHMVINELSRYVDMTLSRYRVQKHTLTAYFADEHGWLNANA